MKFEELVEEIKKQRKFAEDTLSDVTPATARPRSERKKAAKLKLEDLFFKYRQEVRNRILPILVIGEEAQEFAKIAKESKANTGSFRADALYEAITSAIDSKRLARGENAAYIVETATAVLAELAIEAGIASYKMPVYLSKYQEKINSRQKAKMLITRLLNEQVGSEINLFYILDKAARLAYEEGFSGSLYPILLTAENEEVVPELKKSFTILKLPSIVVSVGKTKIEDSINVKKVDEESVLETLKKLKIKLKKK